MRRTLYVIVAYLCVIMCFANSTIAGTTCSTCNLLVWQSPTTIGTCGPCTESFGIDPWCAGDSMVQTITTGYWYCKKAPSGAAGNTACKGVWKVVGRSEPCVMFPNTAAIVACMVGANECISLCEAWLVPGAGWILCLPCAACIGVLGYLCMGCNIRTCALDATQAVPLQRYEKSYSGQACTGS